MNLLEMKKKLISWIETYLDEKKPVYKKSAYKEQAAKILMTLKAIPDVNTFDANWFFIQAVHNSYKSLNTSKLDQLVYCLEWVLMNLYQIPLEKMLELQTGRVQLGSLKLAMGFEPNNKSAQLELKKARKQIADNPILIEKAILTNLIPMMAISKPFLLQFFREDLTKMIQGYLFNKATDVEILKSIGFYSAADFKDMPDKPVEENVKDWKPI